MAERLTIAQARVLRNARDGRRLDHGAHGQSAYGGLSNTLVALHRRSYLDMAGQITEAGRLALAKQEGGK